MTEQISVSELINKQANDERLWFIPTFETQSSEELYLQQELKKLHKIIENNLVNLNDLSFSIRDGIITEKDKYFSRPVTKQEAIMWNLLKKWVKYE